MKNLVPLLINGDIAIDDRGKISFVNTFDFENVKRFYQIRNFSKKQLEHSMDIYKKVNIYMLYQEQ